MIAARSTPEGDRGRRRRLAEDLARVTVDEVHELTARRDRSEQRQFGGLQEFLIEQLELARRYTERLSAQGLALRYRIG